jgi:hypothetical protein
MSSTEFEFDSEPLLGPMGGQQLAKHVSVWKCLRCLVRPHRLRTQLLTACRTEGTFPQGGTVQGRSLSVFAVDPSTCRLAAS